MGWRENCTGWSDGVAGHTFRIRPAARPLCRDRRFPGSHIMCCLYAEHDGDHESEDGDRWRDE